MLATLFGNTFLSFFFFITDKADASPRLKFTFEWF